MTKKITALILCLIFLCAAPVALSGCETAQAKDLMEGVQSSDIEVIGNWSGKEADAVTDFGIRIFQQSLQSDGNTLVSPLSVLSALAMTANGAQGQTRTQMEQVFGMPIELLNEYLHSYCSQLPTAQNCQLSLANSIWIKQDPSFTVNKDFLQTNADYYGASLYQSPFDASTKNAINQWVAKKTDGMIEQIVDEIPQAAVMYLVNAMAFDAQWQEVYQSYQVADGVFTKEDGTTQNVELMYSDEHEYLEDENATGFIKYYQDGKYAFVALLPNQGVSVSDYVSSLTGQRLHQMLSQPQDVQVNAAIPKFQSEYSVEMSDILISLGMADAFDAKRADFSGIGSSTEGNLVINRVLHKTFIGVDEQGTQAGAATAVEMTAESAMAPEEVKMVILDRPFVYLIIDCEANLPLFMGATMEISQ